jgi:hypothetical protein
MLAAAPSAPPLLHVCVLIYMCLDRYCCVCVVIQELAAAALSKDAEALSERVHALEAEVHA